MKEKKKRKILAALIPVAVLFLAAVVFAQGVLKSGPRQYQTRFRESVQTAP